MRPLGAWVGPVTKPRRAAPFRAGWSDTMALLGREVDKLGARLMVLQVDVIEGDIRRDGMLRVGARVGHPGVRVSFESHHGPLSYATDRYTDWRDNVRAIALSLIALRAVDRYGVSRTGEQYRGWIAIEAAPSNADQLARAAALLARASGATRMNGGAYLLDHPADVRVAFARAVKIYHPDMPDGDADMFARLVAARDLLLSGQS